MVRSKFTPVIYRKFDYVNLKNYKTMSTTENLPTIGKKEDVNQLLVALDKFECFTRNLNELAIKIQMIVEDEQGNPRKMELSEWVKIIQSIWDETKDISSECLGKEIQVEFGDNFTGVIVRTVLASIGLRL